MNTEFNLYNVHQLEKIAVPNENGCEFVVIAMINYCEGCGNYTTIYLLDGRKIVVIKLLHEVNELLPAATFFQTHHKYVVNLNQCKQYLKDEEKVELENGSKVKVSQRRIQDFKKTFLNLGPRVR